MAAPLSKRPALVLGLNVTGFGIIRSLSRAGIPVYGVYFDDKVEVGRFSKRSQNFKLPADRPALDTELLQLCKQLGSPVLYPTTDRWCFLLAENREQLAPQIQRRHRAVGLDGSEKPSLRRSLCRASASIF